MPHTPSSWHQRIQEAPTEDAVVTLVREYLDGWSPEDTMALPAACRPGQIHDRDDVCAWAVTLTRERLNVRPDDAPEDLIDQLTETLREAATRLTQLSTETRLLGPRDEK